MTAQIAAPCTKTCITASGLTQQLLIVHNVVDLVQIHDQLQQRQITGRRQQRAGAAGVSFDQSPNWFSSPVNRWLLAFSNGLLVSLSELENKQPV